MCEQKAPKQNVIKNHIWSQVKFNRLSALMCMSMWDYNWHYGWDDNFWDLP
jgi:hypothetical protein